MYLEEKDISLFLHASHMESLDRTVQMFEFDLDCFSFVSVVLYPVRMLQLTSSILEWHMFGMHCWFEEKK